jgi:hypothetical protein
MAAMANSGVRVLESPEGMLDVERVVHLGDLVFEARRTLGHRIRRRRGRVSIIDDTVEDRVFGDLSLLQALVTHVFELALLATRRQDAVTFTLYDDLERIVLDVEVDAEISREKAREFSADKTDGEHRWEVSTSTCEMLAGVHRGRFELAPSEAPRRLIRLELPAAGDARP